MASYESLRGKRYRLFTRCHNPIDAICKVIAQGREIADIYMDDRYIYILSK